MNGTCESRLWRVILVLLSLFWSDVSQKTRAVPGASGMRKKPARATTKVILGRGRGARQWTGERHESELLNSQRVEDEQPSPPRDTSHSLHPFVESSLHESDKDLRGRVGRPEDGKTKGELARGVPRAQDAGCQGDHGG